MSVKSIAAVEDADVAKVHDEPSKLESNAKDTEPRMTEDVGLWGSKTAYESCANVCVVGLCSGK